MKCPSVRSVELAAEEKREYASQAVFSIISPNKQESTVSSVEGNHRVTLLV